MNSNCDVAEILRAANYPNEPSVEFLSSNEAEGKTRFPKYDHFSASEDVLAYESQTSSVFEVPIHQEKARPIGQVSAWEQFGLLACLQREWSDNSVSCTVYYDPDTEGDQLTHMLSMYLPVIKSVSMLPHNADLHYPQLPYEEITKSKYEELVKSLLPIDWSSLGNSDGNVEMYCDNGTCTI